MDYTKDSSVRCICAVTCCYALHRRRTSSHKILEGQDQAVIQDVLMLGQHMCGVHPDVFQRLPDDVQRCDSNGPTAFGTYFRRFLQESKDRIYAALVFLYWVHLDQVPHTPQHTPSLSSGSWVSGMDSQQYVPHYKNALRRGNDQIKN